MSRSKTSLTLLSCAYLVVTLAQTLPSSTLLQDRFARLTRTPFEAAGLWQHWKMFAPEPLRMNIYLDAEVTYKDGSKKTWTFPRSEQMELWQRFQNERWDQWKNYVRGDSHSALWPDAAAYIARRMNQDSANPPVKVSLSRHWMDVPRPPESGFTPLIIPMKYSSYTFFTTDIHASDLETGGRS